MKPDLWGPACWKFLHAVTFSYPKAPTPEERASVAQMFALVGRWLPCAQCRDHFVAAIREDPPQTESREALSQWLCGIHNGVNSG